MFASLFRSELTDRSPFGSFWFSSLGALTASGARVDNDTAMGIATVYACARVLSESFALLPPRFYRPRVGGGRQQVTDHWAVRLFTRAPNPYQTPFEFREMLQGHLAMRGNAYCRIVEDGIGGIAALVPMHPDRITIQRTTNDEFGYRYVYKQPDGSSVMLTRQQIWHLRGMSGDGIVGYNPIQCARESIGEAVQFQGYSSAFFANNATPPFWIEYPGQIATDTARENLKEAIQRATGGRNRGRAMVLDRGMKLNQLQINQKDMQFLEARKFKREEIAQLFRVPQHKVGILERSTNNNIEQQAIEFWVDTMQPYCERWESSIENALLGQDGPDSELEVEFDMRAQMRGDSVARAEYISSGVTAGWLTRNEGREMEGLDPIEGLNEPLVAVNLRGESDPDPNGESGAGEQLPDAPADDGESDDKDARLAALLRGNAARMARRIAEGKPPTGAVLADALAIAPDPAYVWLELFGRRHAEQPMSEDEIAASLVDLGSRP